MDIVKGLKELKTALMGYDKEAVYHFVMDVIREMEEEGQKESGDLQKKNQELQRQLKDAKNHIALMEKQFQSLSLRMEQMTKAMDNGALYNRQRDQELEEFYKKQDDIDHLVENIRQEAAQEKEHLLAEARKSQKELLDQAEQEKEKIVSDAQHQRDEILDECRDSYNDMIDRAVRLRKALDQFRSGILPLFDWLDEELDEVVEEDKEPITTNENENNEKETDEDKKRTTC